MSARLVADNTTPERATAEARFAAHMDQQRRGGTAQPKPCGHETCASETPDLADFSDGFAAGYHARSEYRAALGSPAYRVGYAEGVARAAERRAATGDDADWPGHPWRAVVWALVAIVVGLLLGAVATARADTLDDWQRLNEVCQGASGKVSDQACTQRQKSGTRLRAEGWYQGAHGVWVSPEHVAAFYRIVRHYDAAARANVGMLDKVMEGMMTDLRRAVPPEAIFALWNGSAGELLAHTPYAAALLMHGLPYLERTLSGRNDPRFVMLLRP